MLHRQRHGGSVGQPLTGSHNVPTEVTTVVPAAAGGRRVYVVDTSVLLADPKALTRFAEHEVVLPLVVITELEAKRHHPELGWFARRSLRFLDDLRVRHGRLDESVPVTEAGGTLRVELNHTDPGLLPHGFRADTNDTKILSVAIGLAAEGRAAALALCAGLELVMERRKHKKVIVFRPLYAVGGQELGYLPGTEAEKMSPWAQAVFDTLGAVVHDNVMDEVAARGMLEVLPLTHIRGRSLHDAFVIVDEAQSLERGVLLTVLSRIGQNSRVVLTHDVAQRDNLRVGRHDGVAAVIEALKGHPLFAHVTLTRSERSPVAALVTEMLEGLEP